MGSYQTYLQLHYFIEGQNNHVMDAKIHNMAEQYLLKAIAELQIYIGSAISVKVGVKEKGGIQEVLTIICNDPVINILLGGLVCSFFRPAINKTEEAKNIIEIAQMIKQGNMSNEEIEALIGSSKRLKKRFSKYYETISKENTLIKIEANIPSNDNTSSHGIIERKDFNGHIIAGELITNKEIIEDANIYIVAPVLINRQRLPWKGIYSGRPIDFKIEDTDFLKRVYNQELKFGTGFSIIYRLRIEDIINDNTDEIKSYYSVIEVIRLVDDNAQNFQYETKRHKKNRTQINHPQQFLIHFPDN